MKARCRAGPCGHVHQPSAVMKSGVNSSATSPSPVPCRRQLLGRALDVVAEYAGEVQEHRGRDAGIAPLQSLEEALIDGEQLEILDGYDVRSTLLSPHEPHFAEAVAALQLVDETTPA